MLCASPLQIESQAPVQQNVSRPQTVSWQDAQSQPMPRPPVQQLQGVPPPSPPSPPSQVPGF
jgi:hypothetical protein